MAQVWDITLYERPSTKEEVDALKKSELKAEDYIFITHKGDEVIERFITPVWYADFMIGDILNLITKVNQDNRGDTYGKVKKPSKKYRDYEFSLKLDYDIRLWAMVRNQVTKQLLNGKYV